jgi:hypothetical protein
LTRRSRKPEGINLGTRGQTDGAIVTGGWMVGIYRTSELFRSRPQYELYNKLQKEVVRENGQRDAVIGKLEERIDVLESRLKEIKNQPNTDVSM